VTIFGVSVNGNAPPFLFIIVGCGVLAYLAYGSYKIVQRSRNKWTQNDVNAAWLAFLMGVSLILFGAGRLLLR